MPREGLEWGCLTRGSSNRRKSHCVLSLQELVLGCVNSETHVAQNRAQLWLLPLLHFVLRERQRDELHQPSPTEQAAQDHEIPGHVLCLWCAVANW